MNSILLSNVHLFTSRYGADQTTESKLNEILQMHSKSDTTVKISHLGTKHDKSFENEYQGESNMLSHPPLPMSRNTHLVLYYMKADASDCIPCSVSSATHPHWLPHCLTAQKSSNPSLLPACLQAVCLGAISYTQQLEVLPAHPQTALPAMPPVGAKTFVFYFLHSCYYV